MPDDGRLLDELAEALAPAPRIPDPARIAALRAQVAATSPMSGGDVVPIRSARRPRLLALTATAAAVVLVAAGALLGRAFADGDPAGVIEYRGPIAGASADVGGELVVRRTGIGRVVRLETDDLPILPKGEFYEVWFVGPGDSAASPNRISAGTFHPDDDGSSRVTFAAAVDPALFPAVAVTAESDRDPRPSATEVLRADLA